MKIGVIHEISDAESFYERGPAITDDAPDEFVIHQFHPAVDGTLATCIWEADSLDDLREFIDSSLGDASEQRYFEVDDAAELDASEPLEAGMEDPEGPGGHTFDPEGPGGHTLE